MFQFVGKHKRLLQLLLALLLVPPFAFFGIQSFSRLESGGGDLADVDGSRITPRDLAEAQEQQRDQLRNLLGRGFDPAQLDTPAARRQILDGLVAQRVLGLYMARSRMQITDDEVRALIAAQPAFQQDGKFSRANYEAFVRAQGKTAEQFEAGLRSDLAMRQLTRGLIDSAIVAKTTARRLAEIRAERREVSESLMPASQFLGRVKLAPDAVEAYYKSNPREFEAPEQVRAEYVQLSLDALLAEEVVSPEEVKAAYEATMAPKRRAYLEARKKAEALLAEVRQDPAKFGELAKANSEDSGSAAEGGDLGWFGRGAMVKPFEDAVFRLKLNEIGLVATEFGFHIVQVTGIRAAAGGKGEERRVRHILLKAPPEAKDFDAARAEIEHDLKRQRMQKKFPELAEAFSNLAYEQPDSLQPLVERFKLKATTTGWFARASAPAQLNNPKVVAALFGDDAIRNKRNTEAVETEPGRLVVARVLEHKPAAVRPLDEVRSAITERLTRREALRLAREAGAAKLKQLLESGPDPGATWGPAKTISREAPGGLEPRAVAAVFRVDASRLPAYVGVDLSPAGFAVYRVSKVIAAPAIDDAKLRASETGLARLEARETYDAFIDDLRSRAEITIYEQNVAKKER